MAKSLLGAIVYCWLPLTEAPHEPGPKFRPVLVVEHDQRLGIVRVAPGTTRNLDLLYRGEFLVDDAEAGEGLHCTTKFKLLGSLTLPLEPRFFMGHGRKFRVAGSVPLSRQRLFYEALREAGIYRHTTNAA